MFKLPPLPYEKDALAPYLSAEQLTLHHDKHHQAYVTKLNDLLAGKPELAHPLETIIQKSEGEVFNNAAQIWNHTFYFQCMMPGGGGKPSGDLAHAIDREFGSLKKLHGEIVKAATTLFGSGWVWLVVDGIDKLKVVKMKDADNPLKHGQRAVLALDVWEHAYYVDYKNERAKYAEAFLEHLVCWDFALQNLRVPH